MVVERTDLPKRGMYQSLRSVSYEGGFITFRSSDGNSQLVPIASVIREVDVPELSPDTVPDLTTLAKLIRAILLTHLDIGLLDEGIVDEEYGDLDDFEGALASLGAGI